MSTREEIPAGSTQVSRRNILRAGVLLGAVATVAPAAAKEVATFQDEESGALVEYPVDWSLVEVPVPGLLYPRQAFGLSNADLAEGSLTSLPDLRTAPPDTVYVWLTYEDLVVTDERAKHADKVTDLVTTPSEFALFDAYGAGFNGSDRTFSLRAWVGVNASSGARKEADAIIRSIAVP